MIAWGRNQYGQTDVPPNLTNVVAIAAGGFHNLALKDDSTVVAWGDNLSGQIDVPPDLTNAVAIAAGAYHSLALMVDGTVIAWGRNDYGQANVPSGLSNVVAIAAGGFHNLALNGEGEMIAWGRNDNGQTSIPPGLFNVVSIAAGTYHSSVLKADGTYLSWGDNSYGQTNILSDLATAVAITSGNFHNLALKSDGTVVGWGRNEYGQTNVPTGLSNVVAIAAGGNHSLALKMDGTMLAWGRGDYGQTNIPSELSDVVAIAGGAYHSLALRGGSPPFISAPPLNRSALLGSSVYFRTEAAGARPLAYQWLFNGTNLPNATNALLSLENVQLANAGVYSVRVSNVFGVVTSSEALLALLPFAITLPPQSQVVLLGDMVRLSVRVESTTAVSYQWKFNGMDFLGETNATLTIAHVGMNQAGMYSVQVANTYGEATSSEAQLLVGQLAWLADDFANWGSVLPGVTNIVAISGGFWHNLALKRDGKVVAWGPDVFGQVNVPTGLTNVVAIAGGLEHSLALLSDGSVAAWGQTDVPSGLKDVVAIAAGSVHSLALRTDRTVVAWGWNDDGQTDVPTGLTNVVAIAGGWGHSLALLSDGSVAAWGNNWFGQTDVPSGLTNVVAISSGELHNLALKANGMVVGWGWNDYSQTDIPLGLSNVVAIAAGVDDNLALTGEGILWSWGNHGSDDTIIVSVLTNNIVSMLTNVMAIAARNGNLILLGDGPPFLTTPLLSKSAFSGTTVQFQIAAVGSRPLSYQWRLNGTNLPGATNATLNLSNINHSQAGLYSVLVSNPFGTVLSPGAFLSIPPLLTVVQGYPSSEGVKLMITGEIGRSYRLQGSSDLTGTNWIDLFSFENSNGTTTLYLDSDAENFPSRFYRVISP